MRRADRLFQIVQSLRGGRLVTAEKLADELEVSKRTIYRDVADLIGSGVPITGEAGMGYIMSTDYDMPPLAFTPDEIVALVAGARAIRAYGGEKMARSAEEALVKIESVLPDRSRERLQNVSIHALAPFELQSQTRRFLDALETAENAYLRCEIDYEDQSGGASKRVVQPLGLFFWGKVWTLVAWCELRDDFRMFRVDRIKNLRIGASFKPARERSLKVFFEQEEAASSHCFHIHT